MIYCGQVLRFIFQMQKEVHVYQAMLILQQWIQFTYNIELEKELMPR